MKSLMTTTLGRTLGPIFRSCGGVPEFCTAQCCWRLPAEFARRWLQHIFGAAVLFALAVGLLGGSLFRFGQEVRIGVSEADHYR
jgi:hypothetical protein